MAVVLTGAAVGLVLSFLASRVAATLLFGISSTDPVTFISVPFLLLLVAGAAVWIPPARAARLDPMRALRHD